MFEKLFIEIAQKGAINNIDIDAEIKKLLLFIPNGSFNILLSDLIQNNDEHSETDNIQQGEEV